MNSMTELVERHRQKILDAFTFFWKNPETGYKEWKTHGFLAESFQALGYELTMAGNIPGFYTEVDTGRPGPTIAVMGELDGLLCPSHPDADPQTGAIHCCGHGAQLAALIGVAAALKEPGALAGLSGKIRLMAVPAEELIETAFRKGLREQGQIRYYGGKVEFMHRGFFDGVDLAFMIHTNSLGEGKVGKIVGSGNGCMVKLIEFQGVSAHAGGSPHLGVNAMYAANTALTAINALRETFKDDDHIRVHPIITACGESVNAIPDRVCMESYVRGSKMDALVSANKKVNRALAASAAAIGAKVRIEDFLGYHTIWYDRTMMDVMKTAMEQVLDRVSFEPDTVNGGCSDVGDLSAVMPVLHPYIGGASGKLHGSDMFITDPDLACVDSAKVQMVFLKLMLENDAAKAKEAVSLYKPRYDSCKEYLEAVDALTMDRQCVEYCDDGSVKLYC